MLGNFLLINLEIFTHLIKQKEHISSFFFFLTKLQLIRKTRYLIVKCCQHHIKFLEIYALCALVPSVMSSSLQPYGLYPTRLLRPWDSPGKNTGVGGCALFQRIFPTQGIFLTQGSNPCLMSPALASGTFTTWDAQKCCVHHIKFLEIYNCI